MVWLYHSNQSSEAEEYLKMAIGLCEDYPVNLESVDKSNIEKLKKRLMNCKNKLKGSIDSEERKSCQQDNQETTIESQKEKKSFKCK